MLRFRMLVCHIPHPCLASQREPIQHRTHRVYLLMILPNKSQPFMHVHIPYCHISGGGITSSGRGVKRRDG